MSAINGLSSYGANWTVQRNTNSQVTKLTAAPVIQHSFRYSMTGNPFIPVMAEGVTHQTDLNVVLVTGNSTNYVPDDIPIIWLAATEHSATRWGLERETAQLYWKQVGNREFMTHLLSNMPQVPVQTYEHDRKRWLWLYEGDVENIYQIAEAFYHVVRSFRPTPDTVLVPPPLDLDIPEDW